MSYSKKRYLQAPILKDLKEKMVFIEGPRQVGKTTVSLNIAKNANRKYIYLNWDDASDRKFILKQQFPAENFIIYDELHKFSQWRNYIKGLYDKHKQKRIIVTGSARLSYYKYSGDSLQGRYYHYRLHPFTVKELNIKSQKDMIDLLNLGGFPEPFLSGSHNKAVRWMNNYQLRVIDEDVTSLENSRDLSQMQHLLIRLPQLVGSPLSINSLREDLNVAHKTLSKWLDIFERLYLIYRTPPFGVNHLRTLKKDQKHYHYNWAEVPDEPARFENLVASHLLKWVHFQQDIKGSRTNLCYFRDTARREVDFIIVENQKPKLAIECKLTGQDIDSNLKYFKARFPNVKCIQVHLNIKREFISKEGIYAMRWDTFLKDLI